MVSWNGPTAPSGIGHSHMLNPSSFQACTKGIDNVAVGEVRCKDISILGSHGAFGCTVGRSKWVENPGLCVAQETRREGQVASLLGRRN